MALKTKSFLSCIVKVFAKTKKARKKSYKMSQFFFFYIGFNEQQKIYLIQKACQDYEVTYFKSYDNSCAFIVKNYSENNSL